MSARTSDPRRAPNSVHESAGPREEAPALSWLSRGIAKFLMEFARVHCMIIFAQSELIMSRASDLESSRLELPMLHLGAFVLIVCKVINIQHRSINFNLYWLQTCQNVMVNIVEMQI